MSFSSDVKKELAGLLPEKTCCRAAEAYGLLQMGHAFTLSLIHISAVGGGGTAGDRQEAGRAGGDHLSRRRSPQAALPLRPG